VLKVYPHNPDTLKVLGALYSNYSSIESNSEKPIAKERREKAKTYLTKADELLPGDLDVLFELAMLLQKTEFHVSLEFELKVESSF
jgi:hypothetical protein